MRLKSTRLEGLVNGPELRPKAVAEQADLRYWAPPGGRPEEEVASSAAFVVLGAQGLGVCKFLSRRVE